MATERVDGIALASILAGSLFAYAGIKDKSILSITTGLTQGKSPATALSAGATLGAVSSAGVSGGSASGIAADFERYEGKVPYVWAGANPHGWDCSGSCNYVICHDMGLDIPEFKGGTFTGASHGPSTVTWLSWAPGKLTHLQESEATTDDLVIWQTHMGVIIGQGKDGLEYISAYDTQEGTVRKPVHGGGPWGEVATFWRYGSSFRTNPNPALSDVVSRSGRSRG